jgi:hypothetical protein
MDPAGTHLPVLKHMVGVTTGPVLEMGMGYNSTPILHELCQDRLLVSLDSQTEWVEKFADLRSLSHKIRTVSNWDDIARYLQTILWDIVLIDHWPCERRIIDMQLLRHNTRFMVVHDTEPRVAHCYNYEPTLSLFRYQWEFRDLEPYTTVVSMTDSIPMYFPTQRKIRENQTTLYQLPQTLLPPVVITKEVPETNAGYSWLCAGTSGTPKLSILIATLDSRAKVKAKLVSTINAQCDRFPGAVEVIESSDNGELILGDKRNLLLDKATGDYVVFVDDDDLVADTYIEDIITTIDEHHPDCITFKGVITTDGSNEGEFRFDMNYQHNTWEQDANGVHLRCPSIWCPIKSNIAKSVRFMPIDCAEDRVWAIQLYPLLNTQTYIDKHLYFYRSSTTDTEAQREEKIKKSRKIIDDFRYTPYIRTPTH